MQVQNGTVPGVQRRKRNMFASRTRCKCLLNAPPEIVKRPKSATIFSSVTKSRFSKYLIIGGIIVHGHVRECLFLDLEEGRHIPEA